jgi:hypothetical protein
VLINGAGCIATMQPAFVCSLSVVWGCQRAGEYAIKGRLMHAIQPLFALGSREVFPGYFQYRAFDRWDHGLQAAAFSAAPSSVRSNF